MSETIVLYRIKSTTHSLFLKQFVSRDETRVVKDEIFSLAYHESTVPTEGDRDGRRSGQVRYNPSIHECIVRWPRTYLCMTLLA